MQLIKNIEDKLRYGRLSPVIYKARMVAHTRHLPELSAADRRLADELVADGGTVTHLDDLRLPSTEAFRAAVADLLPSSRGGTCTDRSGTRSWAATRPSTASAWTPRSWRLASPR